MVEVTEIAEDRPFLGEALQKIVSNGGVIALIFKDDDKHVVEMLWRGRGWGRAWGLRRAENRDCPKAQYCTYKIAAIAVPERHVFSNPLWS